MPLKYCHNVKILVSEYLLYFHVFSKHNKISYFDLWVQYDQHIFSISFIRINWGKILWDPFITYLQRLRHYPGRPGSACNWQCSLHQGSLWRYPHWPEEYRIKIYFSLEKSQKYIFSYHMKNANDFWKFVFVLIL